MKRWRILGMFLAAGTPLLAGLAPSAAAPSPAVDLSLYTPSTPNPIAHGYDGTTFLDVEGGDSAPNGVLTLTMPHGYSFVRLVPNSGPRELCTTAGSVTTCRLNHLNTFDGSSLDIFVHAAPDRPIGEHVEVRAKIEPVGATDTNQRNNTVDVPFVVIGVAHLHDTIHIDSTTLYVGHPVLGTGTVTNTGPDPATDAVITLSVPSNPGDVRLAGVGGGTAHGWFIVFKLGTLPPGKTATRSVRITALKPFQSGFAVSGTTSAYDPHVQCDGRACDAAAAVLIKALPASASPTSTPTPASTPAPATTPALALAQTGSSLTGLGMTGLGLLLAGAALLWCGAPKQRPRRAH